MTRPLAALVAVLVALTTAVLLTGPASTATAAHAAHAATPAETPSTAPDVVLDVSRIGPDAVRPDSEITVRATVRNDGSTPVTDLRVRMQAYTPRLVSRLSVQRWAEGRSGVRAGDRLLAELPVDALAPGAAQPVELTAPASTLELPASASSWGPRGLTIEVVDPAFAQLAVARAFFVWDPRPPSTERDDATAVTVLAPLIAGAPDVPSAVVPAARMAELTRDGGRLGRVLTVASRGGVAWALDPELLTSAAAATGEAPVTGLQAATAAPAPAGAAAGEGTPTGAAAPSPGPPADAANVNASVKSWLTELRRAAAGRDVLALPQADPDLSALAHADAGGLYELATQQGRRTVADLLGAPARTDVAWPATGTADGDTLALAARSGATTVVLSAGSQPARQASDRTVTGRSTILSGDNRLDGLLVDSGLSTLLTSATEPARVGAGRAVTTSRLLAETATISRQSVHPPHLLVALPRGWEPDVPAAEAALNALQGAPWVRAAPLRELLGTPAPEVAREPVRQPAGDEAGELPAAGLVKVRDAVDTVQSVAAALTQPDVVLDGAERSAVAATSVAWRDDLPAWRSAVNGLAKQATGVGRGVQVLEGSAVNVLAARAELPVTVRNTLSQDVHAVVSLQPRSPRLVAGPAADVVVPARSSERVALPVRAVANGDTQVVVTVRAPDGALLGEPVTVPVRVRADWETRGILVIGAVLAAVLVAGLVRTIRQGGRRGAAAGARGVEVRERVR